MHLSDWRKGIVNSPHAFLSGEEMPRNSGKCVIKSRGRTLHISVYFVLCAIVPLDALFLVTSVKNESDCCRKEHDGG